MTSNFKFDTQQLLDLAKARRVIIPAGVLACTFLANRWSSWLSHRTANNHVDDDSWDWDKEIVLVTGGCSGIGAQIARAFSEKNIKVVIVDVQDPPVGSELGPNQFYYKLDITSTEDIESIASQIRSEHGPPTVLINNAGTGTAKPILEVPESRLRAIFAVNLISHFQLLREFLPDMVRKNHGHVVSVASMASFATQATNVDYACTKAGVLTLHEGLNQELKHVYKAPRVRTTVVHPSWVRTAMIQDLMDSGSWKESTLEPSEVAAAIVKQVCSGYGGRLILPSSLWWVAGLRVFPMWVQEGVRDSISMVFTKPNK
ncbi:NAD(P)-binding protein [Pleomassaria siparia CBS 279.74]|uniref:Short-chain dehydrogenase/reductase 3 n=1 Tax=Pleomassaria siparia CBS 279.74 TaxID=1314801 RepID=A0A6G1JTB2_9PLEO|nr:NAD(P)-binding protein [Pleomassaria siparia CBS 279.74]